MEPAAENRTYTLNEIFSQPQCWAECLRVLSNDPALAEAHKLAVPGAEWLFVGCGSSYYLALSAAATFSSLGIPARAVPASEILLFPNLVLNTSRRYVPVMISRSGLTSEVLRVASYFETREGIRTIAITCATDQPLGQISYVTLRLLAADEESTVMTRSFTSMLLGLQYLAATISGNMGFADALRRLPEEFAALLPSYAPLIQKFVASHDFDDYVYLAQGPLFGIASEAMLKITESSCSYAQVFHAMEFRHGPKSIVGPETLITSMISESSSAAEIEVSQEMKEYGGTTIAIANSADEHLRKCADLLIEMRLTVPEYARLAAYAVWGQLIGVYTGLKKGLNPDSPKNLSRVVVLQD
jgi:glucosamine--fructose-6-phosphate aminotransferase (isomerizing)